MGPAAAMGRREVKRASLCRRKVLPEGAWRCTSRRAPQVTSCEWPGRMSATAEPGTRERTAMERRWAVEKVTWYPPEAARPARVLESANSCKNTR